ncbi:MAG TPA: hypothetical protein VFY12_04375 [Arenimonas sp.]|nr:hypothetical protein [Arenimonas sp.]
MSLRDRDPASHAASPAGSLPGARARLRQLSAQLLRLAHQPEDREAMAGAAAVVRILTADGQRLGITALHELAQWLERLLLCLHRRELRCDAGLTMLLIDCLGHLGELLDLAAVPDSHPGDAVAAQGRRLLARLQSLCGEVPTPSTPELTPRAAWQVEARHWHLSLRFGGPLRTPDDDPLQLLARLETVGEVRAVEVLPDALPRAIDCDPQHCHLGFEIAFVGPGPTLPTLLGAHAQPLLLAPRCALGDYVSLLRQRPEEPARLGKLLQSCGSLTRLELGYALAALAHPPQRPRPVG